MKPLVYEMDAWSMATLPQLLGASLSLQPLLAMTQSDVPVLQVPFVVGDAVFELSNEWYTTPQGHDFHLPMLRPMEGSPACYRAQQDDAALSLAVIEAIEILRTPSKGLSEATRRHALSKWRFKPATRDGVPYEDWMTMTLSFKLVD